MPEDDLPAAAPTAGPWRLPLSATDEVLPYGPLDGSAPARTLKRVVRRALRWHLWPLTGQVSGHNRAVTAVLAHHRHHLAWLRQEGERLDRDLDLLQPPGGPPPSS